MPELSFNPLNQVYVFNKFVKNLVLDEKAEGFNPLNQVYVFNHADGTVCMHPQLPARFNPLNQVYVFNQVQLKR